MAKREEPEETPQYSRLEGFKFDDWMQEQVQRTPWWAISLAVHLLVIAIFMAVTIDSDAGAQESPITVVVSPPKKEEIKIEPIRDVIEQKKIDTDEVVVQDPVLKDAEVDDHNETDNDEPYEQNKGDSMDFNSDKNQKSNQWNDSIGVGGGAGGSFGGRLGGNKNRKVKGGGGSEKTESAVMAGLKWLARHQNPDGAWSTTNFSANCKTSICEGKGAGANDAGLTGLALLAFLGAGYTHVSRETYKDPYLEREICFGDVVKNGIRWLIKNQDSDGCFGGQSGGKYMYNHAIGALAMAEAYGLTESMLFKEPAQKGIDFTLAAQNPYKGWRYAKRCGDNDTSVVGWCVMALKSANLSNLAVSQAGFDGAKAWIQEVTDDTYYKAGYTAKGTGLVVTPENEGYAPHEALTAVAMMCRMFIDHDKTDPALEGGGKILVDDLPAWDPGAKKIDFYYWYYGSLALYQYDGPNGQYWTTWNKAMINALVPNQRTPKDNCADGSWDSDTKNGIGRWAFEGGRVYTTAINTLTLEIYYRYESAFGSASRGGGKKKPDEKGAEKK
ncbi:MAG: terpene cyclase/mutase family protein [Planctomycetes bacterium]|nr:terpene cyclase/mutase family protein [Planctomycetota bacterium]